MEIKRHKKSSIFCMTICLCLGFTFTGCRDTISAEKTTSKEVDTKKKEQKKTKNALDFNGIYTVNHTEKKVDGKIYKSETEGINAVVVKNAGTLILTNSTLTKIGDGVSGEVSGFQNKNAALAVMGESTAEIESTNITSNVKGASTIAVEEKSSVTLKNSKLTGSEAGGVMMYQKDSNNLERKSAQFYAEDSEIASVQEGPVFYIATAKAKVVLKNTKLSCKGAVLANVTGSSANQRKVERVNGGSFVLSGSSQMLEGNLLCDKRSKIKLELKNESSYVGTLNGNNTAKSAVITLDKTSQWTVTGNSYITTLKNAQEDCSNIKSKGYTVYYNPFSSGNSWLNGRTIQLSEGGVLKPLT